MQPKHITLLFLLTIMPFAWYSLRSDLVGYDGYHYLNLVCGTEKWGDSGLPLEKIVMDVLPCDILVIKLLLFLLCFSSVLAFGAMGELYDETNGWKGGVLIWLAGTFMFEAVKFENDQLAYPFLFWAVYFYLRSIKEGRALYQVASLLLLTVAAGAWGGTLLFLVVLAFASTAIVYKILGALTVFVFSNNIISAILPNSEVLENTPLLGIKFIVLPLVGIVNWVNQRELLAPGVCFVILGFVNPKWAIFSLPFLVCGLVIFYKKNPLFANTITWIAVILAVFGGVGILSQPPMQYEHDAVKFAVDYSDGNRMTNDDELGYLIRSYGGETENYASVRIMTPENQPHSVVVTRFDNLSCNLINAFGELYVWKCPLLDT